MIRKFLLKKKLEKKMNDDKFGDENEAINQIYKIKDLDINIAVW